ncbi:MAG: iron ABC transporter permease [Rhodobacteraceae bacterium]|nr:iron ABC transporter permease [Paracoccaceae bacterium]
MPQEALNHPDAAGAPWRPAGAGGLVWPALALGITALVVLPVAAVVWIALHPAENIWPHMVATTLPRYLANTAVLATGVAVLTAGAGTGAAWLVTMYRFPGSRWIEWALFLPLAVPAYVGAYAVTGFLDYAGPVQTALRAAFGWTSAQDYWFPAIRSRTGAVLVLSAALYPYVYLLARAAFREQSAGSFEVARALGAGPWGTFLRVALPLARPAIVIGVALAVMETVNDYGVVSYFAVQTLTTGIFNVWLVSANPGGAAQLACVVLVVMAALMAVERRSRRRARFFGQSRGGRPVVPQRLTGLRGWLAAGLCLLPVLAGFALPVGVMLAIALGSPEGWVNPGLLRALWNTVVVGGLAALAAVGLAIVMVFGLRQGRGRMLRVLMPVTTLGYALPGAVLAVGLLVPLAAVDQRLADAIAAATGRDPGLLMTGTAFAIGLAYVVRFFALAEGAAEAAFQRVPPSLTYAARSLGETAGGALRRVHLPIMRGSVLTALLLVFVDCAKELPATLLLRPFNYETLATRAHEKASLENLRDAAPAALMIVAVGLVAVVLIAGAQGRMAGGRAA